MQDGRRLLLTLLAILLPGLLLGSAAVSADPGAAQGGQQASHGSITKEVHSTGLCPAPCPDGHGAMAPPVAHGQTVTYAITFSPQDGDASYTAWDQIPQFTTFVSATPAPDRMGTAAEGRRLEWDLTGSQTVTLSVQVNEEAPCLHVMTNVAHVDGWESAQAQVRVVCEGGPEEGTPEPQATGAPPATETPAPAPAANETPAAEETPTPEAEAATPTPTPQVTGVTAPTATPPPDLAGLTAPAATPAPEVAALQSAPGPQPEVLGVQRLPVTGGPLLRLGGALAAAGLGLGLWRLGRRLR